MYVTIEYRASIRAKMADMKQILVVCILCLANTPVFADLENDVRCREISFSKSVEQKDIEAFRSHIDTDARFVSAEVLRGVEQVTAGWSVFFNEGLPAIKWRPQIVEVLDDGRLALSRGLYITTSRSAEGDKVVNWGTFNSVWRLNDDGEWRVVFDAGSPASGSPGEETWAFIEKEDDCP